MSAVHLICPMANCSVRLKKGLFSKNPIGLWHYFWYSPFKRLGPGESSSVKLYFTQCLIKNILINKKSRKQETPNFPDWCGYYHWYLFSAGIDKEADSIFFFFYLPTSLLLLSALPRRTSSEVFLLWPARSNWRSLSPVSLRLNVLSVCLFTLYHLSPCVVINSETFT